MRIHEELAKCSINHSSYTNIQSMGLTSGILRPFQRGRGVPHEPPVSTPMGSTLLICVYQNKDLGILFDKLLSFNAHCAHEQTLVSSILGFIHRST